MMRMQPSPPAPLSPRPPISNPNPNPLPSQTPQNPSQNSQNQNPQKNAHKHHHQMTKSWLNPSFIGANILIIGFSFAFIFLFLILRRPSFWLPVLIVYCVLFTMTQWSYWMTVCTNPGKPPFYYGLSPEIGLDTPRIYCSMCHNFKPERTHHCSSCKQCVLNMDHHCPWVNNCIGFANRKYFILFLIFISTGLAFATIIEIIITIMDIQRVSSTGQVDAVFILRLVLLMITIGLTFALVMFTHFHIKMVVDNTTTLEGMIKKRNQPDSNNNEPVDNYDVGATQNLKQVFGESPVFWALPVKGNGPKGNGTLWPKPDDTRTHNGRDVEATPFKHLKGKITMQPSPNRFY